MILRQYIRACLQEWSEHLDMVMAPGQGFDEEDGEYEDEEDLKAKYPKDNRNPNDPYGGASDARGKRPNALSTSRAGVHTGGVGFGSGPMSGRYPGGTNQGFGGL